jgi:hypothetical protein
VKCVGEAIVPRTSPSHSGLIWVMQPAPSVLAQVVESSPLLRERSVRPDPVGCPPYADSQRNRSPGRSRRNPVWIRLRRSYSSSPILMYAIQSPETTPAAVVVKRASRYQIAAVFWLFVTFSLFEAVFLFAAVALGAAAWFAAVALFVGPALPLPCFPVYASSVVASLFHSRTPLA